MANPTYTMEQLLDWMRNENRMMGWDAIVALLREPTNRVLLQKYINDFHQGSYWSGIGGLVPTGGNEFQESINNFTLDVPRLSFEDTGLDNSRANMKMAIVEGSQLSLYYSTDHWSVTRIYEYTPQSGPMLYLDLLLAEVSGEVDGDRRVRLDLKNSSDFRLTFAKTASEQAEGGRFFKYLFEQLDDEQRVWTLGEIKAGTNPMMRPKSFGLRTQQGAEGGDGAILAFVRMGDRYDGAFPGQNSGFRFLIPHDADKNYSATVLMSRRRVIVAQLLKELGDIIGSHNFNYEFNEDNELVSAVAMEGRVEIESESFIRDFPGYAGGKVVESSLVYEFSFLNAANSLKVEFINDDSAVLSWSASTQVTTTISAVEKDSRLPIMEPASTNHPYGVNLRAEYKLVDNDGGGLIELINYECTYNFDDSPNNNGVVSLLDRQEAFSDFDYEQFIVYLILAMVGSFLTLFLLHIIAITNALERALRRSFPSNFSISEFIQENIALSFGQAIQGTDIRSPGDVGFFGRINPAQTHFTITTPEPLLTAGGSHAFQTEPSMTGLRWTVEDLRRSSRSPGSINPSTGVYQAPGVEQIAGHFTRVRVTATDPATAFSSSALVTVVANPLTINPLITVCNFNERVDLNVGKLGEGAVTLSVRNPGPGSGRIEALDGAYTYVAGERVNNETYVMDEVVATFNGHSQSVYMVVKQQTPGIVVKPVTSATELSAGQIQLKAEINGRDQTNIVDWVIAFDGPGHMDDTIPGLYHVDPNADARFVCIVAEWDSVVIGVYKGHTILPLPFAAFPDALQTLSHS